MKNKAYYLNTKIRNPYIMSKLVGIFGAVNLPRYVPFVKGKSIKFYVKSCGGFQNNADTSHCLIHSLYRCTAFVDAEYIPETGDEIIIHEIGEITNK